jgi:hypothetical protein
MKVNEFRLKDEVPSIKEDYINNSYGRDKWIYAALEVIKQLENLFEILSLFIVYFTRLFVFSIYFIDELFLLHLKE